MATYIYSKWKNSPAGCPDEFYSEIDETHHETRKVEVFKGGRLGYASKMKSTPNTRLGIEPVPSMVKIQAQPEFEIKVITEKDFESMWLTATKA